MWLVVVKVVVVVVVVIVVVVVVKIVVEAPSLHRQYEDPSLELSSRNYYHYPSLVLLHPPSPSNPNRLKAKYYVEECNNPNPNSALTLTLTDEGQVLCRGV